MALSPDGGRIATVDERGVLDVWETTTGNRLVQTLSNPLNPQDTLCFSPNGKYLLSGGADGAIHLWSAQDGDEVRRFRHIAPVRAAVFSPDGRKILSGSGAVIGRQPIDCTVLLWDTATGKQLFQGFMAGPIDAVAFVPGTAFCLSASCDGERRSWFRCLSWWDTEKQRAVDWRLLKTGLVEGFYESAIAISADGNRLLTGDADSAFPLSPRRGFCVRLWNVKTGTEQAVFEGHTARATCLAISPNGRQALSGSEDGTVRLWRLPR